MTTLQGDPRWQRFNDAEYSCSCCGQKFGGVFDISYDHPDCWPHEAFRDSAGQSVIVGDDKLSSDFCLWEGHHFIRATLPLPIVGSDEVFSFGVWGSVHKDQFDLYVKDFNKDEPEAFQGCFSWLMNSVVHFQLEERLACDMQPRSNGQRPQLFVHDGQLAKAQSDGISFDTLLDIYPAAGTDIRPHLS